MTYNNSRFTVTSSAIYKFLCFISLAVSALPIVEYYCPWYVSLIPLVLILLPNMNKSGVFTSLVVTGFLILSFVFVYWFFAKRDNGIFSYFINTGSSFVPCLIAITLKRKNFNKDFYLYYLQMAALMLAITSITTIIGLEIYPQAAREMAAVNIFKEQIGIYYRANIGGYQFIYSLVLFIPIMLWLIKRSKGVVKILNIVELVFSIMCIYESQYTIALIMSALSLFVVFATKNKTRMMVVVAFMVVLIIFNGMYLIGQAFEFFSQHVEFDYVSDKLLQLSQLLKGQNISTETSNDRIECYKLVLSVFGKHPIFGANIFDFKPETISGHSTILDMCAGGGLIGLIIFIAIVRKLYTLIVGIGKKESVIIAVWVLAFAIACLNPIEYILPITVLFTCTMCIQSVKNIEAEEMIEVGEK